MENKFPLKYETNLEADAKVSNTWNCTVNSGETVACAIPPEFNGPGHNFTPEDFFAMSILNCVIASFKVICEKQKKSFDSVKGKAILKLDINPGDNNLYFPEIDITLDVKGASDKEAVKKILDQAIASCPVGKAIKTSKTFHINVS